MALPQVPLIRALGNRVRATTVVGFPVQVTKLAKSYHYNFRKVPFPVIHGDLYRSNILMDDDCNVKAIIDWEGAIVAPWELVKFIKDLRVVPPAMNGPSYQEPLSVCERCEKQGRYVKYVAENEEKQSLDGTLSTVLGNSAVQDFAHAFWLWEEDKAGFYTEIGMFQYFDDSTTEMDCSIIYHT